MVRSFLENRQSRVVLQDWDLSCGAAALATLFQYQHGVDLSEREIAVALINQERYLKNPQLVRRRHGFSLLDLKNFVRSRGYGAVANGGMSVAALADMGPALVPIRSNGYPHFVVFRGMRGNRVLLADPAFGNRTLTIRAFERSWIDYGDKVGRVAFAVEAPPDAAAEDRLSARASDFVFIE